MNPIVSTLIKGMLYLILKAKQGGKYLNRKQVVDRKTGKMRYQYKYKPMQQRAAHEVTRGKFEKVTKLSGDEHKNQIEHALQNGIHVSLHVLRDYPDLAVKYHQQARLAKADKIRAKVKTHKEKERIEREVRLNTPEGLKNNPIKLEAERMMREDGLIKDVPVSDNREVGNKPLTEKIGEHSITLDRNPQNKLYGKGKKFSVSVVSSSKGYDPLSGFGNIFSYNKDFDNYDEAVKYYSEIKEKVKKEGVQSGYTTKEKDVSYYANFYKDSSIPRIKENIEEIKSVEGYQEKYKNKLEALTKILKDREVENNFDTMPESKPEPAKIVNEPAIPDKAVTDFIKKKKAQALGYGGSGKLISQSVFDNSKEMEFLTKYKDIITDTQLDPSISKQQANLLQYLPTDLSKKNYELVSDKDNNDKRYNVQKKLIDFSNQLKTKQLASNVIAELQKILSTHEYHTGDYTSNVDILLKRIEPYQRISSNTSPAKPPDLKANFESWKEERKQAAPAFKLEQEDITSKEKNTRFNDAQGGLFGKKPVTHESYAKKDFKPSLALEGNETITSLVTAVKSALLKEGLDTKAREFVDKAFKEKDLASLKKLASEYVDMKESSQVSNPSTENKGSEEKKMENSVNEAKKQELLEIGDLLVADNNSTTWNTFSNSEKARNKDLFTGRVDKFLPKIQTTVSTESVSPKQISYAEAAKYSNIDLVRTTFKNKLTSSKNKEEFTKVLDHMVKLDTLLNLKTDTLWWLKNKDMGYKSYQELQKMFPNTLK